MDALPEVFAYHDYRGFLRDWYTQRKTAGRISFRSFARRARIGSPSYLKLVIDGERNLSSAMAERFAGACQLEGDASGFFCELVRFNQADTAAERRAAYARLRSYRRYRILHPLEVARDDYHSRWYLPAIRELAACADFREDPAAIAAQLVPPIRASDAARALETLIELGLLVHGPSGKLQQGTALVSSGEATRSLHLGNFHREMIQRAAEALESIPRDRRDISSVTLAVDDAVLAQLNDAIAGFRRQLLELASLSQPPSRVVQVNIQLFPLTRDVSEETP